METMASPFGSRTRDSEDLRYGKQSIQAFGRVVCLFKTGFWIS